MLVIEFSDAILQHFSLLGYSLLQGRWLLIVVLSIIQIEEIIFLFSCSVIVDHLIRRVPTNSCIVVRYALLLLSIKNMLLGTTISWRRLICNRQLMLIDHLQVTLHLPISLLAIHDLTLIKRIIKIVRLRSLIIIWLSLNVLVLDHSPHSASLASVASLNQLMVCWWGLLVVGDSLVVLHNDAWWVIYCLVIFKLLLALLIEMYRLLVVHD